MNFWPHQVGSHSIHEILRAIKDASWQKFRESLKGRPTQEKLDRLDAWRLAHRGDLDTQIQVDNYINALRRGGQLDGANNVVR
jgi:hypothetical protein